MFCLHFLMYIENVNTTWTITIYIWKCIKIWTLKLYIYISYLHSACTFSLYIFYVHYYCSGYFHMYTQCGSEFVLQISNSKLEISSTTSLSHSIYIWSYASVETVFAQTVHGPDTIVLHTLLLLVGKKLRDRDGYFELFSRKNFGYYDLLKSGTITDKL